MSSRKNIILLMTDQQRLDYTGYSGSNIINTPNIDRIAEGVCFTCCQTVDPICTPARTALITGKYPHQIGMLSMSGDLSLQHPTFMQALQKEGYHTSGVGKFHFLQSWKWDTPRGKGIDLVALKEQIKQYGYDYIWETSGKQLALRNYCDYCNHMKNKGLLEEFRDFIESAGPNGDYPSSNTDNVNVWPFEEEDYIDIVTADKIIERIEERPKDKPFYIFGSFCSPHKPYDPPQRYLNMFQKEEVDNFILEDKLVMSEEERAMLYNQRRAAKAMVRLIDDQIGRIFNTLEKEDILNDTVIIFTCDHGDMLGDHYRIQKGVPWKEACTVPTAIRHPDYLSKKIIKSPVEIIDITATILDVAGLDFQDALSKDWPLFNNIVPCISLMPIVTGEKDRIRDYSFSECVFSEENNAISKRTSKWQMIQSEKWKYFRYLEYDEPGESIEEFYDLEKDNDELVNLISDKNYTEAIKWCRDRREYVMDHTPAAQISWAPLINV